jgi:peptide/nickel transport system permease protein
VSVNTGPPSAPEEFAGGTSPGPVGSAALPPSVGAGGAGLAAMAPSAGAGSFGGGRRWEFLHFALRNPKLMIGLSVELIFVAIAIFGPLLAPYSPSYHGTPGLHPSAQHLFGTTYPFGTDVFSQVLYGVRDSYVVGALGALFAGAV